MTERSKSEIEAKSAAIRDAGAGALASGGLAAAFGAASCCALPALLGSFGLGSAWLGSLAVAAGPHRAVLLAVAVSFFVCGTMVIWRRRRVARMEGAACERRRTSLIAKICLFLTAALVGLTLTLG